MKSLAIALSAVILVGCATNPTIGWKRPVVDETKSRMAAASAQAVSLRSALEAKVSEQAGAQVDLNNALLGLGVLTMGLALGKVHHDAYTGTAFLGGSAYLFGTQNMSKPRLAAYQSGISAVNCALRAVSPVNIGPAGENAVSDGARRLPATIDRLQSAIASVERNRVGAPLTAARHSEIDVSLNASKLLLKAAVKTASDSNDLLGRVDAAGAELSGTIDKIAEQVDKLAVDTIPAASTIPQMLAGLASISAGFAPGLTLNQLPTSAKSGTADETKSQSSLIGPPTPVLDQALAEMDTATSAVETIQRPLASRLAAYGAAKSPGSLADCGVSEVVVALGVDVDSLSFKGKVDETQFIGVTGGVKPYFARLRESPSGGVEVKSPLPGDSNVEIFVPKSVESASLHVVVMDGSTPRRSKEVTITIGASPASSPALVGTGAAAGAGAESTGKDKSKALTEKAKGRSLDDRLAKTAAGLQKLADQGEKGKFSIGIAPQNTYTVTGVANASPRSVTVSISCVFAGRAAGDVVQSVRLEMLKKARSLKLLTESPSLDVQDKLGLKVNDPKCLTATS